MKPFSLRANKRAAVSRRFLLTVEQLEKRELLAATLSINDVAVTQPTSGTVNAVLNVTLSEPSSVPVTVGYSTAGLTAQQGIDYELQAPSFTDDFQQGPGSNWTTQVGIVNIQGGRLTGTSALNIASLAKFTYADVQIQGIYDMGPNEKSAGFLARYGGSGDDSYYMGVVWSPSPGVRVAEIFKRVGGISTSLNSNSDGISTFGLLRFEVQGSSLRLYVDNRQLVAATDSALQTGRVGVRVGQDASMVGPFTTNQILAPPTFGDAFNRTLLGPDWSIPVGFVYLQNQEIRGDLTGNVATLAGAYTDTDLKASYSLGANNQQAGLVARYQGDQYGSGDFNMYVALVHGTPGNHKATIWRQFNSTWSILKQELGAPASGEMRFVVRGTSLQFFVGDSIVVTASDTALAIGKIGLRVSEDASFDNFHASPLTDAAYLDDFNRQNSPSLGNNYLDVSGDTQIQSNAVIGVSASSANLSVATQTSSPDVSVEADGTLGSSGVSYLGLIARYRSNADNTGISMYLAHLVNNSGTYTLALWRVLQDSWFRVTIITLSTPPLK